MILVDSSGWIEYYSDSSLASVYAKYIEHPAQVLIPTIVLYEVYKKIKLGQGEAAALSVMAAMQRGKIRPLNDELALIAADHSIQYKLSMADAIVYATARHESVSLVTSDKDLQGLPGVVYHAKRN